MISDCQNEGGPTMAVRLTVIESNMWAIINRGGKEKLREYMEQIFDQASGPTRIPELKDALLQTTEAQCVADPKLETEDVVLGHVDALNTIIGGVRDGPRRVRIAIWAFARLCKHVPDTIIPKLQGPGNVIPMRQALECHPKHEGIRLE